MRNLKMTVSCVMVAMVLAISANNASAALIHQYRMDDNAANNTVVDSVGGANGTYSRPHNAAQNTDQAHNPDRKEGTGSLDFGPFGNLNESKFEVSSGLNYGGGGAMTVAFWFSPDVTLTSGTPRVDLASNLSGSTPGGNQYNFIHNAPADGTLGWRLGSGPTILRSTTTTFNAGQWYHLVATTTAAGASVLYIDGVAEDNDTAGGWGTEGTFSDFVMGTNGGSFDFDGKLDDVRFYDEALSAVDVNAIIHPIPEPASLGLLGVGGLLMLRRRREA
jgi:hypothetical protein